MSDAAFYRVEVAPLTILPLKRSPLFSYSSRVDIPIGAVVSISFGKQELHGVVCTCSQMKTRTASWIKEISSVLMRDVLTQEQIRLAQEISSEYFTPLGKTLVHFLPNETKPSQIRPEETIHRDMCRPCFPRSSTQLKKTITPLFKHERSVLTLHPQDRILAIALLTEEHRKKTHSKQTALILVPEILGAELLSSSLTDLGIEHTLLTSALTRKHFLAAWKNASIPGSVLVGTRQALFAPFKDLGMVIMVDADDDAHKQWDMSPRYDTRRVVPMLTQIFSGTRVISLSAFLDTAQTHARIVSQLIHTDLVSSLPLAPLNIINLRLERYRKNYSPLSVESREYIGHALVRKEKILLITNQSGYSKITVCESCKKIFRCPKCQAMLHPEKSGAFSCAACSYVTPLFPGCFECGHLGFKQIGFGTERIEKEMKKLFPAARIRRIDKNTLEKKSDRARLIEDHIANSADIIIGVPTLLNFLSDGLIRTIVFIDADSMLAWSDFRTDERVALRVFRARLLAGHNGNVFLETFQPENIFLQKLATEPYERIEQTLREDREALSYPPFSRLISVEISRETQAQANKAVKKLEESLRGLPKSEKWRIFIQQASERYFRGRYTAHILLRIRDDTLPHHLTDWLSTLPKDTFVDRDPLSIHV
ncbi:MAG: primosomal protein N' [Candidatus Moranbacteria bacterium]|nr:primosomal protein N' [Candidatus Moranbacteria bacterium]